MTELSSLYHEAAAGHQEALDFLVAFHVLAHQIDDVIDGDLNCNAEQLLRLVSMTCAMCSLPFYRMHAARLQGAVDLILSTYADSVEWERHEGWQGRVADVIRQCGNDIVVTVAGIVGGYQHMRNISLRLRELTYRMQHEVTHG